jgi:inward rectifier potassium channel
MAEPQPQEDVVVIGAPPPSFRDFYHRFLRARWSVALGGIVVFYLGLNSLFALAYVIVGGVANARDRSFWDALCFSVQTMGTIGYGSMYPVSAAANVIVIFESVCSLVVTAVATGLVFAKFSRTTSRVAFSRNVVIGPMDGVPTLMIRVGNERDNAILEANIHVSIIRTVHLKEGSVFYRMSDLKLARHRSPAVARSWTVLHAIDESSPLYGTTPEAVARDEVELVVTLVGTDDTSLQQVHARRRYVHTDILWGARHADVLSEREDGKLVLDIRRFHDVEPTTPTEAFPYPRPAGVPVPAEPLARAAGGQ